MKVGKVPVSKTCFALKNTPLNGFLIAKSHRQKRIELVTRHGGLTGSSRWGSRSHPGLKGSLLVTTSQLSKDQKTQSFFGLGGKSFYLYAII